MGLTREIVICLECSEAGLESVYVYMGGWVAVGVALSTQGLFAFKISKNNHL